MPFAPVHLLFINLLTDSLPAIALGLEPDRSEVMSEKPRLADESILTKDFLSKIGLEGLVIGAMTMISFLTGYNQNGTLLGSTYAFGTLCLARLFHGYNCKSDHPVIFTKGLFHNKWLQGAFVLGAVLITTVLTVPGFHNLFKVETLNLMQLGCVYLYAFASLLIIQLLKYFKNAICTFNWNFDRVYRIGSYLWSLYWLCRGKFSDLYGKSKTGSFIYYSFSAFAADRR